MNLTPELKERLASIRLLALDCDGVLTDGGVYVDDEGREFRRFNIKDGLGLKRVMEVGIHVAIISGATSTAAVHRANSLGIQEVHIGVEDKLTCLKKICERIGVQYPTVAYMGDDLPDLPLLDAVGLSCAPSNAVEVVKARVRLVIARAGGEGAVRELCDILLPPHLIDETEKIT